MTIFVVHPFSDALKAIIFKNPLRDDVTWRGVGGDRNYARGLSSPADNLADGSSGDPAICLLNATPYPMSITPPVGGRVIEHRPTNTPFSTMSHDTGLNVSPTLAATPLSISIISGGAIAVSASMKCRGALPARSAA